MSSSFMGLLISYHHFIIDQESASELCSSKYEHLINQVLRIGCPYLLSHQDLSRFNQLLISLNKDGKIEFSLLITV